MSEEPFDREALQRVIARHLAAEAAEKAEREGSMSPDARTFAAWGTIARYHFECGAVHLADFSARMIADAGEAVRPHLDRLYADAGGKATINESPASEAPAESAADVIARLRAKRAAMTATPAAEAPTTPSGAPAPAAPTPEAADGTGRPATATAPPTGSPKAGEAAPSAPSMPDVARGDTEPPPPPAPFPYSPPATAVRRRAALVVAAVMVAAVLVAVSFLWPFGHAPAAGEVYIDQYGRDDDNLTRCIITAADERGVVLECPAARGYDPPEQRPTSYNYLASRYRLAP